MDILKDTKTKMQQALEHFEKELKNLRSARANPGMLEDVMVEVYGSLMPIKKLGNISVAEARQLLITPFDPSTTSMISKGIERANLNLQSIVDGHQIRVPVPPLSEEVRKEIVKTAKKRAEDAKVVIREIRRKGNEIAKKQKADGILAEDQLKKLEKQVQEATDKACKEIEDKLSLKEKEILSI
ncbi:MAG: ribosome recycling factor [Chlamydiae bacterium]|jgi:ribosome recycling factor|nr:ribosome recycling factor [Chlamydiota bacterium]